jgi:hypothetical protein
MDQDVVAEVVRSARLQEVEDADAKRIYFLGYISVSRFHE